MFNNITKKSFIELLANSENILLFSRLNLTDIGCTKAMNMIYNYSLNSSNNITDARHCIHRGSNSLTFSDGSNLYFSSGSCYYQNNNVIVMYSEYYDTFDKITRYNILAYVIK